LNTSFNIQEPIVCTPEQALATFVRSGVDALVIGNYFIDRAMLPA
jgi:carbamoyltransferase